MLHNFISLLSGFAFDGTMRLGTLNGRSDHLLERQLASSPQKVLPLKNSV